MWERSVGVPSTRCLPRRGRLTARGLGPVRLGTDDHTLLLRAGQPLRRTRAWTYCVKQGDAKGAKKRRAAGGGGVTAVLTPGGRVALVATTAKGHRANGIGPGDSTSLLRKRARRLTKGVWVRKVGKKRRAAYVIKGKRIAMVAVASRDLRGRRALRSYLALVPKQGFTPRTRLVLNRRSRGNLTARNASPLVHAYDPGRRAWFCGIGL
jgi:hypothetical protein